MLETLITAHAANKSLSKPFLVCMVCPDRVRASSAPADTAGSGLETAMSWCAMAGMSSASAAPQAVSAASDIACLSALHLVHLNRFSILSGDPPMRQSCDADNQGVQLWWRQGRVRTAAGLSATR